MKAKRIYYDRQPYADGAIIEICIWKVPSPVRGSAHKFKYRLFFGYPGQRLVCYDNERGKGDHRHIGDREEAYTFTTVEVLIGDFLADVNEAKHERER